MTLRKKTLLIISITLTGLILVLYVTSRTILLNSFIVLEEQDTRRNVERTLNALSGEFSALSTMASDWGAWDDTYAFIKDANSDFIDEYLIDLSFIRFRSNLMLFINSSGQVVCSRGFDLKNKKEVAVPDNTQELLSINKPLLYRQEHGGGVTGIILLPEGPALITFQPILTSEGKGPARGTLIMGRYLDTAEIGYLAELGRCSGTQFDPLLVQKFLQVFGRND